MVNKDEKYYTNKENGAGPPGRDLLEEAAKAAGTDFEKYCLRLPEPITLTRRREQAIEDLSILINGRYESEILDFVDSLYEKEQKRAKRPKIGGRTRKK